MQIQTYAQKWYNDPKQDDFSTNAQICAFSFWCQMLESVQMYGYRNMNWLIIPAHAGHRRSSVYV